MYRTSGALCGYWPRLELELLLAGVHTVLREIVSTGETGVVLVCSSLLYAKADQNQQRPPIDGGRA